MDSNTFSILMSDADKALKERRLSDALRSLAPAAEHAVAHDIRHRIEEIEEAYRYLLNYMSKGMLDPEQAAMRNRFLRDTRTLLIRLTRLAHLKEGISHYAATWKTIGLMHDAKNLTEATERDCTDEHLFNLIWTSDVWDKQQAAAAHQLFEEALLRPHAHSPRAQMMVSAVMLGAIRYFDSLKLDFLIDALTANCEAVRIRALVGVAMVWVTHADLRELYPASAERIRRLAESTEVARIMVLLQMQLVMTLEAQRIEKSMHEDLMPEMIKTAKRLHIDKHLGLNKPFNPEELPGLNPEWEHNKDLEKMMNGVQRMMDMQKKGGDVYLTVFRAVMQHHPFFSRAANWFVPFTDSREEVRTLQQKSPALHTILQKGDFCNTDKFSLCLMSEQMPADMTQAFRQELGEMAQNESETTTIENGLKETTGLLRATMQDLYRFFHLFRHRDDKSNPFRNNWLLTETPDLNQIITEDKALRNIADFCFEEKNFGWAAAIYSRLAPTAEIMQKIGYCHQATKNYTQALNAYDRSTILADETPWLLRQMALCYYATGNYEDALSTNLRRLKTAPDDVKLLLSISDCLIRLDRPEEALTHLYKAEYIDTGSGTPLRALAWCSMLTDKFEQARRYYQKLTSAPSPTPADFLNAGHAAWLRGDVPEAVLLYRKSLPEKTPHASPDFFNEDAEMLCAHGLDAEDLRIMIDCLNEK